MQDTIIITKPAEIKTCTHENVITHTFLLFKHQKNIQIRYINEERTPLGLFTSMINTRRSEKICYLKYPVVNESIWISGVHTMNRNTPLWLNVVSALNPNTSTPVNEWIRIVCWSWTNEMPMHWYLWMWVWARSVYMYTHECKRMCVCLCVVFKYMHICML